MKTFVIALSFVGNLGACKPVRESHRTLSETIASPDAEPIPTTVSAAPSAFMPSGGALFPGRFAPPAAPSNRPVCAVSESDPAVLLAPTGMSRAFLDNCVGCHGLVGQGQQNYPALNSARDAAAFIKTVREGRGGMPAFPEGMISDADLHSDFASLAKSPALPTTLPEGYRDAPLAPAPPIDDQEYGSAMSAGLKAWRNPGQSGSCSSCHGPDGIDLARIGYSNGDILRRAIGQGRTPDEAHAIVRMISAQRRRYLIIAPCSPTTFRPLQPGGRILDGEADAQLDKELRAAGIDLDPAKVDGAPAARALADKMLQLDPSSIPIGIALNKWTNDAIHANAARTTAEWIPELPMEPTTTEAEERWTAAQNRYIESPTPENLWAMYDMVDELSAARVVSGGVAERLSREKYRSVLVLQHMMRTNDRAFPDLHKVQTFLRFSIWETGQVASVMLRGCAEDAVGPTPLACWGYAPAFHAKMAMTSDELIADAQKMVLPWLTSGLIVDPGLQLTENGDAQIQHWHDAAGSSSLPRHEVYFGLLRLVHALDGFDTTLPSGHGFEHASLNGCWNGPHAGLVQWTNSTLKALTGSETASALAVNRMALYLIGAALAAPKPECKTLQSNADLAALINTLGAWGASAQAKSSVDNKKLAADVLSQIK